MAGSGARAKEHRRQWPLVAATVALLLLGLPLAVWADLRAMTENLLRRQADETSRIINDMRGFYADDVVARVLGASGTVAVTHAYRSQAGAIPIPATLSLELGKRITARDGAVKYRFVSDLPFANREPHALDAFERDAIARLRADPARPVVESSGSVFDPGVRIATPVVMGQACVSCHNTHPESPKTDWRVGDVRGIQAISVHQPIEANVFAFKHLMIYFAFAAASGLAFIVLQRRQAAVIRGFNRELAEANDFLAAISMKIAKYIPPQIYKGIFSGQKDVAIATERKKLTIFFSDIQDFTATTERLQPEDLTALLNEYFTAMSAIAEEHGGTVDKFIGDAMLVFFGDPETKGVEEDARACLRMAVAMQRRLRQLNAEWRQRGVEKPFLTRMGVNTGFCNVGNFGSDDRMDYTIIGAEANLAARLQTVAEPGGIVMSYETYALVRDGVRARPLPPIAMKGISREVVPYAFEGSLGEDAGSTEVINSRASGIELYLDPRAVDDAAKVRGLLEQALAVLDGPRTAAPRP